MPLSSKISRLWLFITHYLTTPTQDRNSQETATTLFSIKSGSIIIVIVSLSNFERHIPLNLHVLQSNRIELGSSITRQNTS